MISIDYACPCTDQNKHLNTLTGFLNIFAIHGGSFVLYCACALSDNDGVVRVDICSCVCVYVFCLYVVNNMHLAVMRVCRTVMYVCCT